ncbi:MAG: DUF1343 domain-containing protein [Gemmataceae bacterium]
MRILAFIGAIAFGSVAIADERFHDIRTAVEASIAKGEMPGAVVAVLHQGKVVYRQAFGNRAVEPAAVPMTVDTIFDLASLTKPIATSTCAMKLIEDGRLKLNEKVGSYWPEFAANGKSEVTVEHLLTHTSGLIADNALKDYDSGREKALERIAALPLATPLGSKFTYSDVNFIVLGELVGRVGGMPLNEYARKHVFEPLGLKDTGYLPDESQRARCAPCEQRDGHWMRGEVHDPRAYKLGGVAGHAGLFGTADDLLAFAKCVLDGGRPILKSETVKLWTAARRVPGGRRALGWDVDTSYSRNRGELFPRGTSFGHTGFTGTSIWIDPASQSAVVFLSNRVHPNGKGNVSRVRSEVATIAARAVGVKVQGSQPAAAGIDVLVAEGFARLKGKKVGLVTNHTGRGRDGTPTIDLLHKADGVTLVALFSPEHGIRGLLDEKVSDGKDEKTGLPIYSLYGERRKPTAEQLKGIDTVVFDIQDVGCRFYTYSSTLGLVMEAAAENKLTMVVLDRPNPIGGIEVAGPVRDEGRGSFVAWHIVPLRHGMTFGELASMYRDERKIAVDLNVVKVEGWKRADLYDRTNLSWVNPSPNMRSLTQALLYPGVGLLETTNISVGRGTETPFEWIGAPWLDGRELAGNLTRLGLPGARFVATSRTPTASKFAKELCGGVQVIVDDWKTFEPVRVGLAIAVELRKLYPNDWKIDRYDTLLVHKATFDGLKAGKSADELIAAWQTSLDEFRTRRAKYLLYP